MLSLIKDYLAFLKDPKKSLNNAKGNLYFKSALNYLLQSLVASLVIATIFGLTLIISFFLSSTNFPLVINIDLLLFSAVFWFVILIFMLILTLILNAVIFFGRLIFWKVLGFLNIVPESDAVVFSLSKLNWVVAVFFNPFLISAGLFYLLFFLSKELVFLVSSTIVFIIVWLFNSYCIRKIISNKSLTTLLILAIDALIVVLPSVLATGIILAAILVMMSA
jgi:hypothetical protein